MTIWNRSENRAGRHLGIPDGRRPRPRLVLGMVILCVAAITLSACAPSAHDLAAVDYAPLQLEDWPVSTPEQQGLDPDLLARLYLNAAELESIHSLLVIKNGYLIGEGYFNGGAVDRKDNLKSVTKSYMSALVGIALEQGYLSGVDQKMLASFPELVDQIRDPRKTEITIRQLLQMRAGYPWEESTPELFELLYHGFGESTLVDVPLNKDPGSGCEYSNLSSHVLSLIVTRATGRDLKTFAEEVLFAPLGVEVGFWQQDWDGYYLGFADCHMTARDMAKFGLLYLQDGVYEGQQIVPAEWVNDSLQVYSKDAWKYRVGSHFKDISYGYQWWAVRAGDHHYNLAWGHGGQQIALLDAHDLVIVVTADDLHGQHGDEPWKLEKANLNLVADFIHSLPGD